MASTVGQRIGGDALLRGAGQAGQRRVGERHLAALAAAGALPFRGDRLGQRRDAARRSGRAARQVHRLAIQQDREAVVDRLGGRLIPEALHHRRGVRRGVRPGAE